MGRGLAGSGERAEHVSGPRVLGQQMAQPSVHWLLDGAGVMSWGADGVCREVKATRPGKGDAACLGHPVCY